MSPTRSGSQHASYSRAGVSKFGGAKIPIRALRARGACFRPWFAAQFADGLQSSGFRFAPWVGARRLWPNLQARRGRGWRGRQQRRSRRNLRRVTKCRGRWRRERWDQQQRRPGRYSRWWRQHGRRDGWRIHGWHERGWRRRWRCRKRREYHDARCRVRGRRRLRVGRRLLQLLGRAEGRQCAGMQRGLQTERLCGAWHARRAHEVLGQALRALAELQCCPGDVQGGAALVR